MNTMQALIIAKQSGRITNTEAFVIDAKGAQNYLGFAGRLAGAVRQDRPCGPARQESTAREDRYDDARGIILSRSINPRPYKKRKF